MYINKLILTNLICQDSYKLITHYVDIPTTCTLPCDDPHPPGPSIRIKLMTVSICASPFI